MRRMILCVLIMGMIVAGPLSLKAQAPLEQPAAAASAHELEMKGDAYRLHKSYEQALVFYRAALGQDKNNAVLYNKAGIAELQLNNLDAAQKHFQVAVKKNPHYAEALNNLGVVQYTRKNYKRAIRYYERALAIREDSASVHGNLGTAWFARRNVDKAMAAYARALELDPDVLMRSISGGVAAQISSPEDRAYYSFILARMHARRGDVERCLECLRKAKDEGYARLGDALRLDEFAVVRADPRFAELMGLPPVR